MTVSRREGRRWGRKRGGDDKRGERVREGSVVDSNNSLK